MALARLKNWISGEALDASDLNAEFNNILNNPGSLISPLATAFTPTGGIVGTTPFQIPTVDVGSVAYASQGSAVSHVNGTIYVASVFLPANKTLTGVGVLNAGTVGTSKMIVGLYASTGGAVLVNSALAGATSSGANAFQQIAFTATYAAVGPAMYYIAVQADSATDNIRCIAVSTFLGVLTKSTAGTFGTIGSLTVPTTFTADVGPIAYLY